MNEQDKQRRRNDTARLLRFSSRHHVNCVRINIGSTLKHEAMKLIECWNLRQQGHDIITEAVFENGKRADILDLDAMEAVEIAMTETEESLIQKAKDYPVKVRVIRLKESAAQSPTS